LTVNRLCGSGIQSIVSAAQMIAGEAQLVLAGGMENMSQAPHVLRGARTGFRFGAKSRARGPAVRGAATTRVRFFMAQTAEKIAKKLGHPARGAGRVRAAQPPARRRRGEGGRFADEIVPVTIQTRQGSDRRQDDHIKPETTLEGSRACAPRSARTAR
jgi:acetyl-CoA acetyltransferase